MKESYRKGVATILTPSHVRAVARLHLKRWTGAYVGWVLSSENGNPGSRRCQPCRKATEWCTINASALRPAESKCAFKFLRQMRFQVLAPRPHARIETPCARTERPRGYPRSQGGGSGGESDER